MRKAFSWGRFKSEVRFATLLNSLLVCERAIMEGMGRWSMIAR
jgi:hypothetical protein